MAINKYNPRKFITRSRLIWIIAGLLIVGLIIGVSLALLLHTMDSLVAVPAIDLSVNLGDLNQEGLQLTLQADINNPNHLSLDISDLQIVIEGESGNVITDSTMTGTSIGPDSEGTITGSVLVPLEVLNEEVIVVNLDTSAGIAGFTLPVSTSVTMVMLDIGELFVVPEIEILAGTKIIAAIPLPKLGIDTSIDITNDNKFDLTIGDLQISIFKSDGTLITETTIPGGEIPSSDSQTFSGSVIFTTQQTTSFLTSDYVVLEMKSEAGISGVDMSIPFGAKIIFVPTSFQIGG